MSFVLDSSAALSWCFPEERTAESIALLRRTQHETIYVPALWNIEVANILALAKRKGRITSEALASALKLLNELPLQIEYAETSVPQLIYMSETYGLTTYDATFLDLALRLQLPLATYDGQLARAAEAAGVQLLLHIG